MCLSRTALIVLLLSVAASCCAQESRSEDASAGVVIQQENMDELQQQLSARIQSESASDMKQPGLIGAIGGVHVKLSKTGDQQIQIPLPQLVDAQVPLCYFIRSVPPEAITEYRLQTREKINGVIGVRLNGKRNQDVKIEWSAVVLVTGKTALGDQTSAEAYRCSSACSQSDSDAIMKLADELFPQNGNVDEYAKNVQRYINEMKQVKQPRSLDALGILGSRANFVCTANANLAVALMRVKGIASRSLAVIPPTSQRLEMHRIVEYFHENQWKRFDPSSLHPDIPMKYWQSVIMSQTTISDEELAMKPRMGSMLGCPYGQEIELLSAGVVLAGQDFFWTLAKPLAQFEVDADAVNRAQQAWQRYLQRGSLDAGQIKSCAAKTAREFAVLLQ